MAVATDHSEHFTGTAPVQDRHAFDEAALRDYFTRHVSSDLEGFAVTQFRGGQSNPTFLVKTAARSYVMRRKPPGPLLPSAHAIDREYRVMRALAGSGVPVPRVYAMCEDPEVIGTAFFVMECVEGRVLWDPRLPGISAAERGAIYEEMNRASAALHSVDIAAVDLVSFGRPDSYIARQVARWSKQYRASETERVAAMDRLIDWLPQNLPPETGTSVVHGDFRIDNMIFAADAPRLLAILDWELSTTGDPMADFSYHCMVYRMPPELRGMADLDGEALRTLGIPDERTHLARYCAQRGIAPVAPEQWNYYMAFNLFRSAAIAQGIMARVNSGTAVSPQAMQAARQVEPLASLALRQIDAL